jgi:long-chain acyl-CoA synthetase
MVGVPRLYEKMYAAVYEKLLDASSAKQILFKWALGVGKQYESKKAGKKFISPALAIKHTVAGKLVLSKIRGLLGGRLNFFSAGGAPLSHVIEEFFFSCGIFIAQGYGLTETSPVISCNTPAKFKFGTVGIVIPGCVVKIDDDGEILTRGGNLMKGYYNNPVATAEAITPDGWFRTGDIGIIEPDGFLKITDRKKDIIVTAGGKNISPQNIESMIAKDFYVEQVALIGDKRKYLVALIVPSFLNLEEYAKKNNISFSSREELVEKPQIVKFYSDRIEKINSDLAQFEKIKRFTLMPAEFTQANNEITATMKLKRKNIMERHKTTIDSMFAGNEE